MPNPVTTELLKTKDKENIESIEKNDTPHKRTIIQMTADFLSGST